MFSVTWGSNEDDIHVTPLGPQEDIDLREFVCRTTVILAPGASYGGYLQVLARLWVLLGVLGNEFRSHQSI